MPALVLGLMPAAGFAATYTWVGGGTADRWTQAEQWAEGSSPHLDGARANLDNDIVFYTTGANLDNRLQAAHTIRSLTFNANADNDITIRTVNLSDSALDLTFASDTGTSTLTVEAGATASSITVATSGGGVVLDNNLNVVHNGSGELLIGRPVSGVGGIIKTGTGTMRFNQQSNSFTGNVTINEGTLIDGGATAGGALGTGPKTITLGGGTLLFERNYGANSSMTDKSFVTTASTTSILRYNDQNSNTRNLTFAGGTQSATLNGDLHVQNISSAGGADVIVWNLGTTTGAGFLSYEAAFDDVLNDLNTQRFQVSGDLSGLTGGIEVKRGTWRANSASSLGGGNILLGATGSANSAAINLSASSATTIANPLTVRSGAGVRLIDNASDTTNRSFDGPIQLDGALTYRTTNNDNLNGDLSGTGSLVKLGTGLLDLRGSNGSYSGNITVSEGTVRTVNASAGSGAISVASGAQLTLTQTTGSRLFANPMSGDGGLTIGGNQLVALSGSNTLAGDITITNNATLRVDSAAFNSSTANILNAGSNSLLRLNANAANQTIANAVSGSGSLVKQGDFTTTLSGTNTYAGTTDVNAGTLLVNGNNSGATGTVTVAAGATLGGSGSIGGASNILGIHAPGNSPGIQDFVSDLTYSGGSSSVIWELTANTTLLGDRGTFFDGINVGGNLDFAGTTTLTLDFDLSGSSVDWSDLLWGSNQSWLLYDVAGSTSNLSNFSLLTENWTDKDGDLFDAVLAGSSFNLSQLGSDVYLNFNSGIIPEPSRAVLLTVGFLGLALRRRRA